MNKEQLQQKIDEAKANIELWTKELEKPEPKRWKPEIGETYLYLEYDGDIVSKEWSGNKSDEWCFKLGNVFHFRADAKCLREAYKERDRRLAEAELLDMCDRLQSKPYEPKKMWFIYFNTISDEAVIGWDLDSVQNPYIFATKESAQKAIDTLGIDKLKLIFRVA